MQSLNVKHKFHHAAERNLYTCFLSISQAVMFPFANSKHVGCVLLIRQGFHRALCVLVLLCLMSKSLQNLCFYCCHGRYPNGQMEEAVGSFRFSFYV